MTRTIQWKLTVDSSGAVTKLEQVSKEAEKTDKAFDKTKKGAKDTESSIKSLGSAFGGLKGMIGMAAGALGAFGAGFGIKEIISNTSELAKETEEFHATTGMGAKSSLDYVAALKARGIGTEAVTRGYKALSKAVQTAERQQYTFAIGQATASAKGKMFTSQLGTSAEAFQRIGISFSQFKSLSPERQFEEITKKFEGMKAGIEKTRLASQLFGRGGTALLPVLEGGALSLSRFKTMAEKFFPTLKGEGVQSLEQLREKQAESKLAWEGLEFTIGMKLAPALSTALGWFSKLIQQIEAGHGVWGTLEKDINIAVSVLKEGWTWIEHNKTALDGLIGVLGILGFAWGIDKIEKFIGAIKEFTVISKMATAVRALGVALGLLPAEEEGAAASTGILGASLDTIMPELLALTAAFGVYESLTHKAKGGPLEFKGKKSIGKEVVEKAASLNPAYAESLGEGPHENRRLRQLYEHELSHHEYATPQAKQSLERYLAQGSSSVKQDKIDLHIDGRKVAEALARNPNAVRYLAEGAERGSLQRNARR